MAQRYRKVYSLIWDDEDFQELSRDEKLVALYCLTCKNSNRIGLYCFSAAEAAEKLGIGSAEFDGIFRSVLKRLEWPYDDRRKVLYIPSWWKWNRPDNPNILKAALEDLNELPKTDLIAQFAANGRHLQGEFWETFRERFGNVGGNVSPQEQEQKNNNNNNTAEPKVVVVEKNEWPTNGEASDLLATLRTRGMSEAFATKAVQTTDPALLREILRYHLSELAAGRLKSPVGSLRAMLKQPANWGFERTESGWRNPASGSAPEPAKSLDSIRERVRREREAEESLTRKKGGAHGFKDRGG